MDTELYHLCNRGVDKRTIFLDDQDRLRFIHDLFEFNDQQSTTASLYYFSKSLDIGCPKIMPRVRETRKLLLNIHCFSLMPNHYHLLVSPLIDNAIPLFMKKLNMGYAKYFNERYQRVGALFQGKYRSVLVERDAHFLHLPYYIHFNPLDMVAPEWREGRVHDAKKALGFLERYRWSSHRDFLGEKNFPSVTQRDFLLDFFGGQKAYRASINEAIATMEHDEIRSLTFDDN